MAELAYRVKGTRKTDSSACYYVYERPDSATRKKINRWSEFKRLNYLLYKYTSMLFGKDDNVFISARIVATIIHYKRLF